MKSQSKHFLTERLPFTRIAPTIEQMLETYHPPPPNTIDDVLQIDREARARSSSSCWQSSMTLMTTIAAFLVTLGVLVVIHEHGHYWVARKVGVKVLRFSIGFGRPLARWVRGPDRTEWVLSALPLGGYVRMLDERDPECLPIADADLPRAFNRQSVAKRIAIVLAGPVANLLLAVAVYWFLSVVGVFEPAAVVGTPAPAMRPRGPGCWRAIPWLASPATQCVRGTNCAGCCCSARFQPNRSKSKSKAVTHGVVS